MHSLEQSKERLASKTASKRKSKSLRSRIAWGLLVVAVLLVTYGAIVYKYAGNWAHGALFGEAFGAFNAAFSALAFIGILFTLWAQDRQLDQHQNEIERVLEHQDAERKHAMLTLLSWP